MKEHKRTIKTNDTKNIVINIRLSPNENKLLRANASAVGKNVSVFLREKALDDNDSLYAGIPRQIDILNLVNEIYHEAKKCHDTNCREELLGIIRKYAVSENGGNAK